MSNLPDAIKDIVADVLLAQDLVNLMHETTELIAATNLSPDAIRGWVLVLSQTSTQLHDVLATLQANLSAKPKRAPRKDSTCH